MKEKIFKAIKEDMVYTGYNDMNGGWYFTIKKQGGGEARRQWKNNFKIVGETVIPEFYIKWKYVSKMREN